MCIATKLLSCRLLFSHFRLVRPSQLDCLFRIVQIMLLHVGEYLIFILYQELLSHHVLLNLRKLKCAVHNSEQYKTSNTKSNGFVNVMLAAILNRSGNDSKVWCYYKKAYKCHIVHNINMMILSI